MSGALVVIGGHEDRHGDRVILRAFAEEVAGGRVALATVASGNPEGYVETYRAAFADLGVHELVELRLGPDQSTAEGLAALDGVSGVFFTGGQQARALRRLAGTAVEERLHELWRGGVAVAGTSAGASLLGDVMLVRGPGEATPGEGELRLERGLGLLRDIVIDQHFAERGRIGRLVATLAQRPESLGIGLDEDTALVVRGRVAQVVGSGAVYVVDPAEAEAPSGDRGGRPSALADLRLHVLAAGDGFDLDERRPSIS